MFLLFYDYVINKAARTLKRSDNERFQYKIKHKDDHLFENQMGLISTASTLAPPHNGVHNRDTPAYMLRPKGHCRYYTLPKHLAFDTKKMWQNVG